MLILVAKNFVQDCFVAQIRAKMGMRAEIRAYMREKATPIYSMQNPWLRTLELKYLRIGYVRYLGARNRKA